MAHIINNKTGKLTYMPEQTPEPTPQPSPQANTETQPQKTYKNNFDSNNVLIRDGLNSFGFDNNAIGYDGTNVTYNGKSIMKPTENVDGVTKIDAKGFIDGVNKYNKEQGIDDYIVDVTSYAAANSRLPNAVEYHDNGNVTVGGFPIENVVIIDGNSYAPKSAIEAAVNKLKQSTGYTTHMELANKHLADTKEKADMYMNKIDNYAPFAYDPATDPIYKAYAAMYERNANAAHENTLHINNARTGGYSNSAAIAAGNQAYYNHMAELADRVPQFEANAYNRYMDQYNMLWKGLEAYGSPYDRYLLAQNANAMDINAMYNSLEADYRRSIDNRDFNYKKSIDERDFAYKSALDAWERENILLPQSQHYMQENDYYGSLYPLLLAQEQEKLIGLRFDNRTDAAKHGYSY